MEHLPSDTQSRAERIANAIMHEIRNRRGFRQLFDAMDGADCTRLIDDLATVVTKEFARNAREEAP